MLCHLQNHFCPLQLSDPSFSALASCRITHSGQHSSSYLQSLNSQVPSHNYLWSPPPTCSLSVIVEAVRTVLSSRSFSFSHALLYQTVTENVWMLEIDAHKKWVRMEWLPQEQNRWWAFVMADLLAWCATVHNGRYGRELNLQIYMQWLCVDIYNAFCEKVVEL